MTHDLKLLVVKGEEGAGEGPGFYECIMPSVQAGLGGDQTIFILWAMAEPLIAGGRIVLGEGDKDCCRVVLATGNSICETTPEGSYDLEEFNFFVLGSLYGPGGGVEGPAFRIAKRLTASGVNIKDILLITHEGLPPEYYSDADLYGISSVNSIDVFHVLKREIQALLELSVHISDTQGQVECAGEYPVAPKEPEVAEAPVPSVSGGPAAGPPEAGSLWRRVGEISGIAVFVLACLIVAGLISNGMHPGRNLLGKPAQRTAGVTIPPMEKKPVVEKEDSRTQTPPVAVKTPAIRKSAPWKHTTRKSAVDKKVVWKTNPLLQEEKGKVAAQFVRQPGGGATAMKNETPYRRSFAPPRDDF